MSFEERNSESYKFITPDEHGDAKGQEMTFTEAKQYLERPYDIYDQMIADVVISVKTILDRGLIDIPKDYNIHVGEGYDDPAIQELCRRVKEENANLFTDERNLDEVEERMGFYSSLILTDRATDAERDILVRMFEERFGIPRAGSFINFVVMDVLNGVLVSSETRALREVSTKLLDATKENPPEPTK